MTEEINESLCLYMEQFNFMLSSYKKMKEKNV